MAPVWALTAAGEAAYTVLLAWACPFPSARGVFNLYVCRRVCIISWALAFWQPFQHTCVVWLRFRRHLCICECLHFLCWCACMHGMHIHVVPYASITNI